MLWCFVSTRGYHTRTSPRHSGARQRRPDPGSHTGRLSFAVFWRKVAATVRSGNLGLWRRERSANVSAPTPRTGIGSRGADSGMGDGRLGREIGAALAEHARHAPVPRPSWESIRLGKAARRRREIAGSTLAAVVSVSLALFLAFATPLAAGDSFGAGGTASVGSRSIRAPRPPAAPALVRLESPAPATGTGNATSTDAPLVAGTPAPSGAAAAHAVPTAPVTRE